ncbi:MAG: enoyl-CoA hydratase [Myxococcota bacterium]
MQLHRSLDDNGVLTLALDDGAKNALGTEAFDKIIAAFDEAGDDVRAFVLTGREEIFTAGLDVKFLGSATGDEVGAMLIRFGEALMRVWGEGRPTVAACTGHAIAAGTMFAMACDHAVAAEGRYRWGLTETQVGVEIPMYGIEIARGNVAAHRVDDLLVPGAVVDPDTAVEVGFADELAPLDAVLATAQAKAAALAELPSAAYAGTKTRLRGAVIERTLTNLHADIAAVMVTAPFG